MVLYWPLISDGCVLLVWLLLLWILMWVMMTMQVTKRELVLWRLRGMPARKLCRGSSMRGLLRGGKGGWRLAPLLLLLLWLRLHDVSQPSHRRDQRGSAIAQRTQRNKATRLESGRNQQVVSSCHEQVRKGLVEAGVPHACTRPCLVQQRQAVLHPGFSRA